MKERRKRNLRKHRGTLIIIGGHEDKKKEMVILSEIAKRTGSKKLCIATVASTVGNELWEEYRSIFKKLGVKKISHLDLVNRNQAVDRLALSTVENAGTVFFTGGDQLRITSELGGTKVADEIMEVYHNGGLIAGTSAGASVMGEIMMIGGESDNSFRVQSSLHMAPGLGFVKKVIIDQHFAERGRIGRLIGATAHNPRYLGIGIDENTCVIFQQNIFEVLGCGAVYVLDAHKSTYCNISEAKAESALSIFNVRFHLLSEGDRFDFLKRAPIIAVSEKKLK